MWSSKERYVHTPGTPCSQGSLGGSNVVGTFATGTFPGESPQPGPVLAPQVQQAKAIGVGSFSRVVAHGVLGVLSQGTQQLIMGPRGGTGESPQPSGRGRGKTEKELEAVIQESCMASPLLTKR